MRNFLAKVWFPAAVVFAAASQAVDFRSPVENDVGVAAFAVPMLENPSVSPDTVIYSTPGYKRGWSEEEKRGIVEQLVITDDGADSIWVEQDEVEVTDTLTRPAALDTLIAPDSLKFIDLFRYTYYAALRDSLSHIWIRDSLKAAGDSLDWPKLDSLYIADSLSFEKEKFDLWYASLSKAERKKYDNEQKFAAKIIALDSIKTAKDSIKQYKDSILAVTPRILETFALTDSMKFKRIIFWTRSTAFHKMNIHEPDTTFNYHFNDYPFLKEDVNAVWLGVAGSPVQYYDFFKRKSTEKVSFYEAQESWSHSVEDLPFYNSKTPHTELAYWGTLFADKQKASDNIRIFTTQNITPELNVTFEFNRFGGEGILESESTANKTLAVSTNYLGKKYLMHAGYIYNMVARKENGGIIDNTWIRDTTVDSRDIGIALKDASSKIKKNSVFLDQQYRIPFYFLDKMSKRKDSLNAGNTSDSTYFNTDVTTAFIGHSSEFSTYTRKYTDLINTEEEGSFYNNTFYYHPSSSADSTRVMRLDNKAFIRLQPWSDEGAVSKLDVGIGYKLMKYYMMDPTFLHKPSNRNWNSSYLYAGAEGQISKYVHWDALGDFDFAGNEAGDFSIAANAGFNFFPFRRAKKSPVSINAHFETSLNEPEFYEQHYFSNHYKWENEFSKISSTKIQGEIDIPEWKLKASVGYSLLANNIYYDTLGIVRQNTAPMSIFSARLDKNFEIANLIHLDHKVLFQLSSNNEIVPLPMVALNLRYYIQFTIQKVLKMQIGANGFYTTAWNMPGWNPEVGVFHNQSKEQYGNCPYFDVFLNMQWKRACIFVKLENAGQGWPMDKADYFSAHHYIRTQRAIKIGFFWPFYIQPGKSFGGASGQGDNSNRSGSNR